MKISKQLNKLKNLNVEAEKCSTREEAKKIINRPNHPMNLCSVKRFVSIDFS